MAPPNVYSASDPINQQGFYMQDQLEAESILYCEVRHLKKNNLIPAIAGVAPSRKEMLSDQRGYIMKADQNTVRLNLSEKSYLKHNRRAYRVSMMFVKRNLFSIAETES